MRRGLWLVAILALILAAGAGLAGWRALRSEATRPGVRDWYGLRGVSAAPSDPRSQGATVILPARVTITWNVATLQAKVYVGQSFCGLVGQGGEQNAAKKMRQIMAAQRPSGLPQPASLDADRWLPFEKAAPVLSILGAITPNPVFPEIEPARPQAAGKPQASAAGSVEIVEVEAPQRIPNDIDPLLLVYHPPTAGWSAGVAPGELQAAGRGGELNRWLREHLKQRGAGSPPVAIITVPGYLRWQEVCKVVEALREAGITDLYYRTKPPVPAAPAPSGSPGTK